MTDRFIPETVTVWRNGAFAKETTPTWWAEEMDIAYPPGGPKNGRSPFGVDYGNIGMQFVEEVSLSDGYGSLVVFGNGDFFRTVWCPSDGDALDLMTTRALAWLQLGVADEQTREQTK